MGGAVAYRVRYSLSACRLALGLALLTVLFLPPSDVSALTSPLTIRASVDDLGRESAGPSAYPAVSSDGRYIAFNSGARTLVADDTNNYDDVFVRDTFTGKHGAPASIHRARRATTRAIGPRSRPAEA